MFKKLALIVILLLVLSASASAYSAIVNVKFNSLKAPNNKELLLADAVVFKVWNMDGIQVPSSTSATYPSISANSYFGQTIMQSPIIELTSGTQYYITVEAPAVCTFAPNTISSCWGKATTCWGWCNSTAQNNAKKTATNCYATTYWGVPPISANFGGTCDVPPTDGYSPVASNVASPGTLNLGASKNITFTAP